MSESERVAVIGASRKQDRYSFKAISLLTEYGHTPFGVSPADQVILGNSTFRNLQEVPKPLDTVTLYVNPRISEPMAQEIIEAGPKRVIMNPGTESEVLKKKLTEAGIRVIEACTLVLLRTNQF